ncbi:hypothetical protein HN51_043699 [Arachis hypogaea]|nr:probable disease resistance protein RPP1 [Arachis hypogaea]
MESSVESASSTSAGWSWTICLFTLGVFLGTFMPSMFLSWKSSLERKILRGLFGYRSSSFAPACPPLPMEEIAVTNEEPSTSKSIIERKSLLQQNDDYKYDVFLSFIGTDSSKNFTRFLNQSMIGKGISTFKVNKRLDEEAIDPIPPQHILQAIRASRISIVVFSRDYARSTWCLEELATIMDCSKDRLNQVVFPVYYDMERIHVQRQTGAYEDAFLLHSKKFKRQEVDRWRKAMDDLTNWRYWIIKKSSEIKDSESLVQQVLNKLVSKLSRCDSDDLVGNQLPPKVTNKDSHLSMITLISNANMYESPVSIGTDCSLISSSTLPKISSPTAPSLSKYRSHYSSSYSTYTPSYAPTWNISYPSRSSSADDSVRLRPSMGSKVINSNQSGQQNPPLRANNFLSSHVNERTTPASTSRMSKSDSHFSFATSSPRASSVAALPSTFLVAPRFGPLLDNKFSSSNIASASISNQSGKSSSQQRLYKYDVFLSFRGKSTRNNFANHLCNCLIRLGISTFSYDKRGEKEGDCIILPSQVLQAIQDSQISIVILTKDYADSIWCLEEMSAIVDNNSHLRGLNKGIIPIFYDLEHFSVRMDKRLHRDARVHRWKNALMSLANLQGQSVRNKPKFQEIENIIKMVMNRLGHKFSKSSDGLVGIQPRIECLENLLKLHSSDDEDDFRVLGICGMDGIGKTTYASVLYDTIFDHFDVCCFIENVSQIYRDGDAIGLQQKILHQISNEANLEIHSLFELSGFIRKRLSPNHKVLIVLDNVDKLEQLLQKLGISPKLLGIGSRIIITTRDEHILKVYGADEIHKVSLLDYNDAYELFLRQAFKDKSRNSGCMELVPEILEYAQGLPLAIKSLGSFFRTRDATIFEWEHAFESLRKKSKQSNFGHFSNKF